MKIIFSRKGFDSASGGCPSPIFPDGSMISLPIPDRDAPVAYRDLTWEGRNLGDLVATLTKGRQRADYRAHLDPDLLPGMRPRPPGWRPAFGQCGAAQSHLANQGVGPGDLFLFFGLFREVDGQGRFRPTSPARHILWGWMRVGATIPVEANREQLGWAEGHPHLSIISERRNNVLYVAADRLDLEGAPDLPGAGVWQCFHPARQLTAPGGPCSVWRLPAWLRPDGKRPTLSYHTDPAAWRPCDGGVLLQTVGRGQEFVLDASGHPEAGEWVAGRWGRLPGHCRLRDKEHGGNASERGEDSLAVRMICGQG